MTGRHSPGSLPDAMSEPEEREVMQMTIYEMISTILQTAELAVAVFAIIYSDHNRLK